jgi:prepilin peptidase CpaA
LNGSPVELVAAAILLLLLVIACVSDIRTRRIPNSLVGTVLALGVLASTASDPVVPGLIRALGGASVGLVVWLPGWLLRTMGAGDVKLFAAAGAWLGPLGALNAALFAAVAGGVLALIWMLTVRGAAGTNRTLWSAVAAPRTLLNARTDSTSSRELVPYSLAITVGVVVQLARPGLVFG